jgi:serine/threonine protein kinase
VPRSARRFWSISKVKSYGVFTESRIGRSTRRNAPKRDPDGSCVDGCLKNKAGSDGKLRHAAIAELLDYGVERGVYRLAFPLYGVSVRKLLDDALATRTCLTPQMAASVLVAVGEALAECHAVQLTHGDIKPDNVLQHNASWVLVDLGSCSSFDAPLRDRRDCLALQDFAAAHCTLSYRAPELWQPSIGDRRDGAADVFARRARGPSTSASTRRGPRARPNRNCYAAVARERNASRPPLEEFLSRLLGQK